MHRAGSTRAHEDGWITASNSAARSWHCLVSLWDWQQGDVPFFPHLFMIWIHWSSISLPEPFLNTVHLAGHRRASSLSLFLHNPLSHYHFMRTLEEKQKVMHFIKYGADVWEQLVIAFAMHRLLRLDDTSHCTVTARALKSVRWQMNLPQLVISVEFMGCENN